MKTYQERLLAPALLLTALLLPALLLVSFTTPAFAEKPLLPGIPQQDRRVMVDAGQAPWRSLVKVQTNLGTRCTGVLVAPRRVVTAGHCLLNRAFQTLPASSVHVLFGFERGSYKEHVTVAFLAVGGPHDPKRTLDGLAGDWAVLTLTGDAPAGVEPLPLSRVPPQAGAMLMLGGYSQDHALNITADTSCAVLGSLRTGRGDLLFHNCVGTHGVSGGAVLTPAADGASGRWEVAGVTVAVSVDGGSPHNIAVPAASFLATVEGKTAANTPSSR